MSKKFVFINTDGIEEESAGAFEQADHLAASAGVGSAGLPIVLDAAGKIDSSMINFGAIDHGGLSGLADDDHTQYLLIDGTRAMSGTLDMNGNPILISAAPTLAAHAVNKAYADAVAAGLRPKGNVEVASTANVSVASAPAAIDGITLTSGDRVLLKDQTDAKENGIYVFNGAAAAMTRSEDQDNDPLAEIVNGVLIPQVLQGTVNALIPFFISSVGTGVDGMHTIGVDNIVWDVFTSPTQLQAGNGIDITSNNITVDIASLSGLKFVTGQLAIEPNDFAGLGLIDDGSDNLAIDFSTAFNDEKAVAAQDLNSVTNGEGASIIGIEDANSRFTGINVEAALDELWLKADVSTGDTATTDGTGVTKGDLLYMTANGIVSVMPINAMHRCVGIALSTVGASLPVRYARWDELVEGVLTGATFGTRYYWSGSALTTTIPAGSGQYVWAVGVAKNATDLVATVEFVKKNS